MNVVAGPPKPRLRLAVVSTYDDLCGIAGYTRALVQQLQPLMDVVVFDLDQFLLRSTHRRIQRLGDEYMADMARRLSEFDAVNIQLEFGTLGSTTSQILRRMRMLAAGAPTLSVTFHTVLDLEGIDWSAMGRSLLSLRPDIAFGLFKANMRATRLTRGMHRIFRLTKNTKPIGFVFHGKREARLMSDLHRHRNVVWHPLSFISSADAKAIRATTSRTDFAQLSHLSSDSVFIGVFGFISEYKGLDTAIKALRLLPENHHLLIFGGVHPQTIRRQQPINSYLEALLAEGRIGKSVADLLAAMPKTELQVSDGAANLLAPPPHDLTRRIHFMGALPDSEFARALAICDVVAMPYREVGQTSSGALAMALDLGCRIIASRTRNFLQLGRAMPGRMEFCDIGNFSELAQRILTPGPRVLDISDLPYNTQTNADLYLNLHEALVQRVHPRQVASPLLQGKTVPGKLPAWH
jgi:glycosyltransferase involved in cell wall biosynthesis